MSESERATRVAAAALCVPSKEPESRGRGRGDPLQSARSMAQRKEARRLGLILLALVIALFLFPLVYVWLHDQPR